MFSNAGHEDYHWAFCSENYSAGKDGGSACVKDIFALPVGFCTNRVPKLYVVYQPKMV